MSSLSAFLDGFGRVLDITGSMHSTRYENLKRKLSQPGSDYLALNEDWEKVRKDIWSVVEREERNR